MSATHSSPSATGARVLRLWTRLSPLPGGRWLFGRILRWMIPYSGSLGAVVVHLAPGSATVVLRDRRAVRNHLRSVHAVALANLGELASGLALTLALPAGVRGIVTELDIVYRKKARGRLRAESRCDAPPSDAAGAYPVVAHVFDEAGDEVATLTASWTLGPVPERSRHG